MDENLRKAKVTLVLAQAAQVADGLLNVLGAGWNQTVVGTPCAIGVIAELPWEAIGEKHRFRLELLDDQGKAVVLPTPPAGELKPVVLEGEFEVAPKPGTKRGTPMSWPLAINLGPMPLDGGKRYEWRLEIDGETHEDWRLGFSTLPSSPQAQAA